MQIEGEPKTTPDQNAQNEINFYDLNDSFINDEEVMVRIIFFYRKNIFSLTNLKMKS
jgi:hypothetical protein